VETNALFSSRHIAPVLAGPLPAMVASLSVRHARNQMETVQAALTCDRQLALNILLNDPQMAAVRPQDAETMLSRMLDNTIDALPAGWRAG